MTAIYQREMRSYLTSAVGYVFLAVFYAIAGYYFFATSLVSNSTDLSYVFSNLFSIVIFLVPMLTMRLFSEERRQKTEQALFTAPVSFTGVVMGKFLAMATIFLIPVALCAFCPLIIAMNGEARLLSDYAALLAFFLMGCVFIAIGMFLSSLTESQIIAAVSTFAVLLVLFLWDDLVSFLPSALSSLLSAFSFTQVFYNFVQYSMFDLSGLVLYLSLTFLFLFLTVQTLQKRRWA